MPQPPFPRMARIGSVFACVAATNLASWHPVWAQSASQITPRSFAPPLETAPGGAGLRIGPVPGLETPPGADKLFVTLSNVTISGGFSELAATNDAVGARLTGHKISGAEIFAAARDLEAAYAQAGYVLTRIVLPAQTVDSGGRLTLTVIDGTIERIDTAAVPIGVRTFIERTVAPLLHKTHLRLRELERRVLLAGDTPGVLLRSTLTAGTQPGAAVLVLEATRQAVTTTVNADNTLATGLGQGQGGIATTLNSITGHGERVYAGVTGDPFADSAGLVARYPRNRVLVAGAVVPIGYDGWTFNIEATQADTTPLATDAIASTDHFQRLSLRLRYPWVRGRDLNLASTLIFDAQDEEDSALIDNDRLPLSLDRLRILRMTHEASYVDTGGGVLTGTLTLSQGIDALGARSAADATVTLPLSAQGSDATFTKVDGTLGYTRPLAAHLSSSVSVRGQTGFNTPMAHSEQIGIAGPGGLTSFDVGVFEGDSGVVGRAELAAPYPVAGAFHGVGVLISPYVFGAAGTVFLAQPTAQQVSALRAAAYGVGLRLGGAVAGSLSGGQIALEFGRQSAGDHRPIDNRITINASVTF